MPLKPSQPFANRHTYIPPHVQQAMDRQMQRSMPPNLRKYTEGNSYIPRHAEQAIAAHMEKVMPAQFKKYSGAYVQQKVMSQHMAIAKANPEALPRPAAMPSAPPPAAAPAVNPPLEQSAVPAFAIAAAPPDAHPEAIEPLHPMSIPDGATPTAAPEPTPIPAPAATPAAAMPAGQPSQEYDFIVNPEQPAKKAKLPGLPSTNSVPARMLVVGGGILALCVVFIVVKGLVAGGPDLTPYVGVAQDQQELIHLLADTTTAQQQDLTTTHLNFIATAQLSLTSSQAQILTYLTNNKQKVSPKVLNLKLNPALDTQLANAAAATTYDQTFQSITQTQLNSYINDMQRAYQQTNGKIGHALLQDQYKQAQLLLIQLDANPQ